MSERPPEEKAVFDRVMKLLETSTAQTPGTVDEAMALSDLDAALTCALILCRDIEAMTDGGRIIRRCGWCIVADGDSVEAWDRAKRYTPEEINAHAVQCPHNPLVRAVYAALNALDVITVGQGALTHEIEVAARVAIDTLARMVGR